MKKACGFTLIEMMISLSILAILAAVAVPVVQLSEQREKERQLRLALSDIRAAIDAYKRATEQGGVLLAVGDSGYPPSLAALADGIDDLRSPTPKKRYFLRRLPIDPMTGNRDWAVRSHDSPPDRPAPGKDVFDVYSQSSGIGLNGVPYKAW